MTRIDQVLNIFVLALVLAVLFVAAASAQPVDRTATQWLWPQQSIAISQSTTALVMGHPARAVTMAERGLSTVQGHDRLVALHNLCIGWLQQRDPARAAPACEQALTMAAHAANGFAGQPEFAVVKANIDRERGAHDARLANTMP